MVETIAANGALTVAQKQVVIDWLNSKSPLIGKCPICGDRKWNVSDHLVSAPIYYGGGNMMIGGPTYPNAQVMCMNCGNTQFINAVFIGLLPGVPPNKPGGVT